MTTRSVSHSNARNSGAILDRVLVSMLTEGTGTAMCDSGGESNRHWQRNQTLNTVAAWRALPEVAVAYSTCADEETPGKLWAYCDVTVNVFHFLSKALSRYEAGLTRQLHRFGNRTQWKDDAWLSIVDAWIEEKGFEESDTYGTGWINTYNSEDALSQTLQYRVFTIDGDDYAAIQIHGGADVRGGYTKPRVFRLSEDTRLCDNARFTLSDGRFSWDYDNAGYALEAVSDGAQNGWDGESARAEGGNPFETDSDKPGAFAFTTDPAERGKGKLYVDNETQTGYSPHNGEAITGYIL